MCELPLELPNHLRLKKLGNLKNQENLETLQNYCLALSPPPEMKILSVLIKSPEKPKLNFSRSPLFHMNNRVCLKYFVNNCLWK